MKPTIPLAACLLLFSLPAAGGETRLADPRVIEALQARDLPVMPKYTDPALWPRRPFVRPEMLVDEAPDTQFLRTFAEYEPNQGILMRWRPGNFNTELAGMIVPITTGDSHAKVYLVVRPASGDQAHAEDWLGDAGADLDRVEFIEAPNDSVWIRDYGPRFVSADFERVIIDHTYEVGGRPLDDQIPGAVADHKGEALYEIPLVHGGGNYHQFSDGRAYVTDSILDRNPGLSAQDIEDYFALYQGAEVTLLDSLPQHFDGTQHLDMWFLPVDEETVIIGDYTDPPPGTEHIPQEVVDVTEGTADLMQDMGYTVKRIPGWRDTNPEPWGDLTHITYTNSVITNDVVITCEYPGYTEQNDEVMDVMQTAFPDHDVVAIDCSNIINSSGALHCVVKHMPRSEQYGERPPYYDWNRWDGG